jgi:uncharacterized protein (DUF983 family)
VFPFVAARYLVRRFGGSPRRVGDDRGLMCPRCGTEEVVRLQANRVSPFPGYSCAACGLRMRPRGTGVFYAAVLAACVGLLALFTLPLWAGGSGEWRVFPFVLVVAAYSVYQLLRPTPWRARVAPDEEPNGG